MLAFLLKSMLANAAILKTVKSPYLGSSSTDLQEFWNDDAY